MVVTAKVLEKISALQLPRGIEVKATDIYKKLPQEIRASKKTSQIVHLCVSEAYKTLRLVYHPGELATRLKVSNPNDLLKEAARHGYRPVLCHYSPHDWLRDYMRTAGISGEHHQDVELMVDLVLEKIPALHEKSPCGVAAGVVAFFAMINGYDQIKEAEFASEIQVSLNIIKQMKKLVSRAHAL